MYILHKQSTDLAKTVIDIKIFFLKNGFVKKGVSDWVTSGLKLTRYFLPVFLLFLIICLAGFMYLGEETGEFRTFSDITFT